MGARDTYRILISDSAPEIASAASLLQMAHVPLTPGRPQQSGHIERSGGMVKELFESMLLESKLPRNLFWKIAIEQAAFALNVVVDKSGESAFSRALEEQSWLIPLAFGCLIW
eukprot:6327182-Amphidinium_carterae.1